MARIEMSYEGHTREYNIDDSVIIGRGENCDVKVPSGKASREHCRVFKGTGGYFLEDLGSANGTVLNGTLIGRKLLKHNDEITVGRIKLRFIDKTEDALIGRRLGKYQILEKIGVGAEGVIYHGRQLALNKDVAIKLLEPDFVMRKGGIRKIKEGMGCALEFEHENVVRLYDFVEEKGRCFYVMELVYGENLLDKTIRKKRIKVDDVFQYGISLSAALTALHSNGVLHGDIKPQNIIIDNNNNLKLIDLGWLQIEHDEDESHSTSEDHTDADTEESKYDEKKVFATPQYVAPELINHEPRREQSDIYAMGVTLYHLLTGELPYKEKKIEELLKQHIMGNVQNPCEVNKRIPCKLGELIIRAMECDPNNRVKTAEEFNHALLGIRKEFIKKKQQNKEKLIKKIKQKKFGSIKIGASYKILAVLVFLLLGASYGVRKYNEYALNRQEFVLEKLELGEELYRDGEYDKAENVIREVLAENVNAETEIRAKKILGLLRLPQAVRELHVLQKKLSDGEVTKLKLIALLRDKLRSDSLDMEEEKEYIAYLKSIGGDADVRYDWQKQIDLYLDSKELLLAFELLEKISSNDFDRYEQKIFESYTLNVKNQLDTLVKVEYARAGKLLKQNNIAQAGTILNNIVNTYPAGLGWRERILAYFANGNEEVASGTINAFSDAMGKIDDLDNVGLRELIFQLDEFTTKIPSTIDSGSLKSLPNYLDAFEKIFIKKIKDADKTATSKENLVEITVDGNTELVELDFENNGFVAYAQDSKLSIEMHNIASTSIEKILPVFDITTEEAVGAGLYFIARGSDNIGKGYLESALNGTDKLISKDIKGYLGFLKGKVVLPIVNTSTSDNAVVSESCIKVGGSSLYFPVTTAEYLFAVATGGELRISVRESELIIVKKVAGREEELGRAIILAQEGGRIEIKGYWDKLIISQNDVVVGEVGREEIGGMMIAPIQNARLKYLAIQKNVPVKKRFREGKTGSEVLG